MNPIQVPAEWDDNGIILFEEFCHFIRKLQRTVRDLRRCGRGPRWWRFNGNGRLFTTVAELRRFLRPAVANSRDAAPSASILTTSTASFSVFPIDRGEGSRTRQVIPNRISWWGE